MKNKSKVLVLFSLSLLISSCSKKEIVTTEEYGNQVNDKSFQISSPSIIKEDNSEESSIKPFLQTKDVVQLEDRRQMIREASIHFTVQDIVKTVLAIDEMTAKVGGFIEKKDFDFHILDIQTQNIANGKTNVFEKVNPIAVMTIRVPSDKAAEFVNQLLPLMLFLNQQQYSAKRYELKLLEEKIEQAQIIPKDTKNTQLDEISKLTQLEVQDRVRFSTISLYMDQSPIIRERIDINTNEIIRLNADSFWKRAWSGVQSGWQLILDLIIFLITIWPAYLFMLIGLAVYRVVSLFFHNNKS